MVLNYIWIAFFLIAMVVAAVRLVFFGDTMVFDTIVKSTFETAKTGFELSLGLTGVLTLWLGLMKIGEMGGAVNVLARLTRPFFTRLFPELPKDHPAHGSIVMNFAANILGLDNAATPLGLKAMQEMQSVNKEKDTATNAQIMFLVLNTSGLTIIPISIMVYRAQAGAVNPADVFVPLLISTYVGSLIALIVVSMVQRINLLDRVILAYLIGSAVFVGGIMYALAQAPQDQMQTISSVVASVTLFSVIAGFIAMAALMRVNVYEAFIEGAKDGFNVAIRIIPYLIAILVAVGVLRASGALDYFVQGVGSVLTAIGVPTEWVPGLPTAIMKPLSGSGARGMMVDAMTTYGADSFVGRLVSTLQGSTDTTFYILALYFGSVGIKKTRHAVPCGLVADFAGITTAILVSYFFWG